MNAEEIEQHVRRARAGDRAAFREIVLACENDLRFHLGAFEVTPGLADEVLQATFVSAFRNLAQYRHEGAFLAWLKAIARNQLRKILREQRRFADVSGDVLEGLLVQSGVDEIEQLDHAEELDRKTRKLRGCVERLPKLLRGLVEGRYIKQQSSKRLGEALGRSEVWVRVTLYRARQALRRCMEGPAAT